MVLDSGQRQFAWARHRFLSFPATRTVMELGGGPVFSEGYNVRTVTADLQPIKTSAWAPFDRHVLVRARRPRNGQ